VKNWFGKYRDPEAEMNASELKRMMLQPSTKAAFFLLYSKLLQVRCGLTDLQFSDDSTLCFEGSQGFTYTLHLENLWILCNEDRSAADETIEKYVSVVANHGREPAIEKNKIVAWIRDRAFMELLGANLAVVVRHFVADLWVVYAARAEGGSRSISHTELAELELTEEELFPLALKNLRRLLLPFEQTNFSNFTLLTAGSDFTPALLLLNEVWEELADQFPGDMVIVAPTSDSVFVTSSESPGGIRHLRKRAFELEQTADHIVSTTLLRRVAGVWKAFD
jgi:uncharacterized protein YtpQ (UPF0354 family)